MPTAHIVVDTELRPTPRTRQLEAMFDVPPGQKAHLEWDVDMPIEGMDWNVGLIVGPSGCGKTTVAREIFGDAFHPEISWGDGSVIDDFDKKLSINEISAACQAVGFNTIPAWLRPKRVLSNGEQFRVDLARRMMELPDPIVVDEFTSVVDRQVAQIGAHAVQKWTRKNGRKFVAVSCHYDIIDWLNPDWVFEPATGKFERRLLRPRPKLPIQIAPVNYDAWRLFAPFHYMSADLNKAARCYCLFVNDNPAAFAAVLYRPHPRVQNIRGVSRLVTLPDWQGLGLAFVLVDFLGGCYQACGERLRTYPAHPALIRGFDRSPNWAIDKKPGQYNATGKSSGTNDPNSSMAGYKNMGMRPNATFEYVGKPVEKDCARQMVMGA